ncbi:MAG: GTPase HflX [Lachnospiraceae bacterium]|jgi:GTPase|nr:GTPase HflX [Lachnospiraceae bacterium]
MGEIYKNDQLIEKVILVGVCLQEGDDTKDSLEELEELCETAGAQVCATIIQNRDGFHPGTYVGTGKLLEIKEAIAQYQATGIVCDDELSPAQLKNMEQELECKIMDRTMIILDIFAKRATTSEGKIQVELAQLKYRSARLIGFGKSMSRLGAGIGTRGPGENKLETDRRIIKDRIAQLRQELNEVVRHREVTRSQREKKNATVVAIVGYTNAGKSTLLNRLTDAGVLEEDQLFATLDPTTRNLKLESGQEILLTDTVGFIRKLPHHLIEAFRSTLEEAKYADIILHVVDASNPQKDKHMHIVYDTLAQLGVKDKKIITLFNKMDRVTTQEEWNDVKADWSICMQAKNRIGFEELLDGIESILRERKVLIERLFSYDEAGKIQEIRKNGELLSEEYREDGIFVRAYVEPSMYHI